MEKPGGMTICCTREPRTSKLPHATYTLRSIGDFIYPDIEGRVYLLVKYRCNSSNTVFRLLTIFKTD